MKKLPLMFFIISFFLNLNQIPGFAQTWYSLQDLVQKANKLSETILIAKDDVEIANQEEKRALSVLIPRFTAFGAVNEYKNDNISAPDTLTGGIKLTQSFTLNGKELIALDVTQRSIESKEFALESIRSEYLLQVSQAYYNILSVQRTVEISKSDVDRLATHRDAVKEKLSVGNVTKTDLYRAEAELAKSMTVLVSAENGVLQAKAALKNLVDIDDEFELEKAPFERVQAYDTSIDEIQSFALKNRFEIKEAKKNLDIAQKTVKFEKSDYWPSVSLEAGYKETDIEYESGSTDVEYDTEDLYVSGELVFTLYDGGLRRAQIRQAVAKVRQAKNALALQEKKIILDSKISFLEYDTAKSSLDNLQEELKSAQENYNAVQMQYKYGMADSIDIMDANTLLVRAQRKISDAEYTLYLSVLKILYTRGDLTSFLFSSAQ